MINALPVTTERSAALSEVLHVWARAFGCPVNEVTSVAVKAGVPIEKLWNSIRRRASDRA